MNMKRKMRGFSIIELLAVMAMGLICISVVVKVLVNYQNSSRMQNALADIQENVRFASSVLHKNIQEAGFLGCARCGSGTKESFLAIYKHNNAGWGPSIPASFKIKPKKATDVILVRFMSPITGKLQHISGNRLTIIDGPKIYKKKPIAVTDCNHYEIATVIGVSKYSSSQVITINRTLATKISTNNDTEIGQFNTVIFFIGKTSRKDNNKKPVYSLYMNKNGRKSELVPNVENMWIKNDKNLVTIDLLFRSRNVVYLNNVKHEFAGESFFDRYLYRDMGFVVGV